MALVAVTAAGLVGTAAGTVEAQAETALTCTGALPNQLPPKHPGPLRFGIGPHVQAGQAAGAGAPAVPEDRSRQISNLRLLAGSRPFVLRLTRIFWPDTPEQQQQLAGEVATYSGAGFLLEFQLRYHPATQAGGDPAAFATWVAGIVHAYDSNPALVSVQVTNEVNFQSSPDSSDGYYAGSRDALIQGVENAKQQAQADGSAVRIGFNWAYRSDPASEQSFWSYLHDHGGEALVAATDWVGLDAYPGTFFPPAESGQTGFYNGMVNALSQLRDCFMPAGGFPAATPIYIEETGYPTEPGSRPPRTQVEAVNGLVTAALDYAGPQGYNVTDLRWFNLRDANSADPNFQQHFGLMYSDYTPKPAFAAYQRLVSGLRPDEAATAAAPRPAPASPSALPFTAGARPGWAGTGLCAVAALLIIAGLAVSRMHRLR